MLLVCQLMDVSQQKPEVPIEWLSSACRTAILRARAKGDTVVHIRSDLKRIETLTDCHATGREAIFLSTAGDLFKIPNLVSIIRNNFSRRVFLVGFIDAHILARLCTQMQSRGILFDVKPEAVRILERIAI